MTVEGSQFTLNNSSYSGADIKVVVQVYRETLTKETQAELEQVNEEASKLEKDLAEVKKKRDAQKHIGVTELSLYDTRIARLETQIYAIRTNFQHNADTLSQSAQVSNKKITQVGTQTKVLAEIQTLSVSVHRAKSPVRSFGRVYPVGFVRGDRQIAGSAIFTVFNEHVLYEFLESHPSDFDAMRDTSGMLDQIPPVDILISFANEYGYVSRMTIYGVEFVDEGQVMSIEDIMTENTVHWVARDMDPMRSVSKRKMDKNGALLQGTQMLSASNLILEEDYQQVKNALDPFERFSNRRNPFI